MKPTSDWQTLKQVARKLHAELLKTHGEQAGAVVEAMEIARRRAEIDQTQEDWRLRHGLTLGNGACILDDAIDLFASLAVEFGAQRAVHILTAIEREKARAQWSKDLIAWRGKNGFTPEQAAVALRISVEDVTALERVDFSAGPEAMRLVRAALRRVRDELKTETADQT